MRKYLVWSGWFAGLNGVLILLVNSIYLYSILPIDFYQIGPLWKTLIIIFLAVTDLASASQLALLFWCIFLLPLCILHRTPKISLSISCLFAIVAMTILLLDANIYSTFHFHLNSAFMTLLTDRHVFEFAGLSHRELSEIAIILIIIIAAEISLAWGLWEHWIPRKGRRCGKMLVVSAMSCILYSYLMFGLSLGSTRRFAEYTAIFPFYNTILASLIPVEHANISLDRLAETSFQQIRTSHGKVNYPKHELQFTPPRKPLNLLVIVIDAWRFDGLRADVMPNTTQFAKQAWQYQQHFSGGNATMPGFFSLFYSIPSWYWSAMIENKQEPALFTALAKQGYNFQLFASANMMLPAFNRTLFIKHPELRVKALDDKPYIGETLNTKAEIAFFKKPIKQPFFAISYHVMAQSYCTQFDGATPFKPYEKNCDRISFSPMRSRALYLNRYWNALHFVDNQVGQILQALKEQKLLDNTVVIITGDHGQEFNDNGLNYWEHAGNFTRYQVQTPLLISWPGSSPKTITEQTSHYDIAPFLMRHLLGNTNDISDYSIGQDLLHRKPQKFLMVGSYINFGVREESRIINWYTTGRIEITDLSGKPIHGATLPANTVQKILTSIREYLVV